MIARQLRHDQHVIRIGVVVADTHHIVSQGLMRGDHQALGALAFGLEAHDKIVAHIYGVGPALEILKLAFALQHGDVLNGAAGSRQVGIPVAVAHVLERACFIVECLKHEARQQVEIAVAILLRQLSDTVVPDLQLGGVLVGLIDIEHSPQGI